MRGSSADSTRQALGTVGAQAIRNFPCQGRTFRPNPNVAATPLRHRNDLSAPGRQPGSRSLAAQGPVAPGRALRGLGPRAPQAGRGPHRPLTADGGKRRKTPRTAACFQHFRREPGRNLCLGGRGAARPRRAPSPGPSAETRGVGPGRGGCLVRDGPPRGLPGLTPHRCRCGGRSGAGGGGGGGGGGDSPRWRPLLPSPLARPGSLRRVNPGGSEAEAPVAAPSPQPSFLRRQKPDTGTAPRSPSGERRLCPGGAGRPLRRCPAARPCRGPARRRRSRRPARSSPPAPCHVSRGAGRHRFPSGSSSFTSKRPAWAGPRRPADRSSPTGGKVSGGGGRAGVRGELPGHGVRQSGFPPPPPPPRRAASPRVCFQPVESRPLGAAGAGEAASFPLSDTLPPPPPYPAWRSCYRPGSWGYERAGQPSAPAGTGSSRVQGFAVSAHSCSCAFLPAAFWKSLSCSV